MGYLLKGLEKFPLASKDNELCPELWYSKAFRHVFKHWCFQWELSTCLR